MKKITRNLLISGAAIFVIGAAIFVIGMSAIGWDFAGLDAVEYAERKFVPESESAVTVVNINVDSFEVIVKSGTDVSLDYYEASDSDVSVNVTDGVLEVSEKKKPEKFLNGLFNFGRVGKKYVLTVVSGMNVKIGGNNAKLELNGIDTDTVDVDCTNAVLDFADCDISTLRVDSTNLTLNVNDTDCDAMTVKSVNTTVKVSRSQITSVSVDGTNIKADFDVVASDTVSIDGTNNVCSLKGLTVNKLALDGTNLKASVHIDGKRSEYTVAIDGDRESGSDPNKLVTFDGTNIKAELKFSDNA